MGSHLRPSAFSSSNNPFGKSKENPLRKSNPFGCLEESEDKNSSYLKAFYK